MNKDTKFQRAAYAGGLPEDPKPTKGGGHKLFITDELIEVRTFGQRTRGIVRWSDVARVEITTGQSGGAFGVLSPSTQQRVEVAVTRKDGMAARYELFRVSPAQVRAALSLRLIPLGIEIAA